MRRLPCPASWLWCVLAIVAAFSVAAAVETPQASGHFNYSGGSFELAGAYAFPSRVGISDEDGIKVAVSNAGFVSEFIDRSWDREAFIDSKFADDETAVVYLHVSTQGKYLGASWFLGSGHSCGFCSSGSASSSRPPSCVRKYPRSLFAQTWSGLRSSAIVM